MKASDVITRARYVLQDAGAHYWTAPELLAWLADARTETYKARPDLYAATVDLALEPGVTQALPDGGRWLFEVVSNVSSARQRQITLVEERVLARHRPNWRSTAAAAEIRHYLYDDRKPAQFDVYPPARDAVTVKINYAKVPAAPVDATDLTEEGEHAASLVDWVLYRAFLKEADTVPAFFQRAQQHQVAFNQAITGNIQTKLSTSPKGTV